MKNTHCLRLTLTFLILFGTWYPDHMFKNMFSKNIYHAYSIMYLAVVYFPTIGFQIMHLISVLGDVEAMMGICLLLLTHFAMMPKLYIIWKRQDKIKMLLKLIDSDKFTREEPEKKAILEKVSKFAYIVSVAFSCLVGFTGGLWTIFPMLKPTLELPLGYPYMDSHAQGFIPLYIFQIVNITILGIHDAAGDLLFAGTLCLASGEMDVLYYELNSIGDKADIDDLTLSKQELSLYSEAVSCVKFHEDIIMLINEMDGAFGLPLLLQFGMSSIIICGIAVRISMSSEAMEILTMMFYLCCVNGELLLLCYFGDLIKHKSERLSEGAYFSNWRRMSLRTRRVILMFMMRAQRPLTVTAATMFDVTLTTFTMVLRTSYSYFAVINQRN